jgi:hypothetical protein
MSTGLCLWLSIDDGIYSARQRLWISIAVTGNVIFFWKLWIIITQYIQSIDETIKKRCPPLQQQQKKKMTIGIKTSQSIQITIEIKVFRQLFFKIKIFSCIYKMKWNHFINAEQNEMMVVVTFNFTLILNLTKNWNILSSYTHT